LDTSNGFMLGSSTTNDFVICCRGTADEAAAAMRDMMERLKLTVNERKTKRCRVPEETFDFLGYTFGRCYSMQTGRAYLGTRPAKPGSQALRILHELTSRRFLWLEPEELVGRLNRRLTGWANYFCLGPVSKAYRAWMPTPRTGFVGGCAKNTKIRKSGIALPGLLPRRDLEPVRLWKQNTQPPWAKA
jgi:hypothetical protein